MEIKKEIMEMVNKPGRIGTLSTANKQGQPNVAYLGSPRLTPEGTMILALGNNRTLRNLNENPNAVFFCIADGPVAFTTPGYRLYMKVKEIQNQGPILDGIKSAIAKMGATDAAKMMVAAVIFEVTEIRPMVARG
ncbi:MAG: pyridoxamine 5'-phosphate oxidase family protein [Dehalococcoidia bacterium]|nr:pyridoxamine 5'-phosphate oxidase family protein [Dehalococcoidia bacterium]